MENLKSIKVKIIYSENLKKITGKDFEEVSEFDILKNGDELNLIG